MKYLLWRTSFISQQHFPVFRAERNYFVSIAFREGMALKISLSDIPNIDIEIISVG